MATNPNSTIEELKCKVQHTAHPAATVSRTGKNLITRSFPSSYKQKLREQRDKDRLAINNLHRQARGQKPKY